MAVKLYDSQHWLCMQWQWENLFCQFLMKKKYHRSFNTYTTEANEQVVERPSGAR